MAWVPLAAAAIQGGSSAAKAAPAGPSSADAVFGGGMNWGFDNSGWNVAFSGSEIDSTAHKTLDQAAGTPGGLSGLMGQADQYLPYAIIFIVGLVAWKTLAKK